MNMINTNLWDKYNGLLTEDIFEDDMPQNIENPVQNMAKGTPGEEMDSIEEKPFLGKAYPAFLALKSTAEKLNFTPEQGNEYEKGTIRDVELLIDAIKKQEELNDREKKYNWNIDKGNYEEMINLIERSGNTYSLFYSMNPSFLLDEEEAIQKGKFFEPQSTLVIRFGNQDILNMQLIKELSLECEDISDLENESLNQRWIPFIGTGRKEEIYAYSESVENNKFVILKLNGWKKDDIENADLISYQINKILNYNNDIKGKENSNITIINNTGKSVEEEFKGASLNNFYESQISGQNSEKNDGLDLYKFLHKLNAEEIPGLQVNLDGTILTNKDKSLFYKINNESKMKKYSESLSQTISLIANELGLENFDSNKYLEENISGGNITGLDLLWDKNEAFKKIMWSIQYSEFRRIDPNLGGSIISSNGQTCRIFPEGKILKSIIASLYANEINNYEEVIKNFLYSVDPKEIEIINKSTECNFTDISLLSYFINGLNKNNEYMQTKIAKINTTTENHIFVYNTFRSADVIYNEKGKDPIPFNPNTVTKPTVDHIDGNHGNNDFRNLRLATHQFNSSYAGTFGFFLFGLEPTNNNNNIINIKWTLKYDPKYRLVLPVGYGNEVTCNIENNFGGLYRLVNVSGYAGSDSENYEKMKDTPSNKPVSLSIKGVSVFTDRNKESRDILVGVPELINSGYSMKFSDKNKENELIDFSFEDQIKTALKVGGTKKTIAYAGNVTNETMEAIAKEKYGSILNVGQDDINNNNTSNEFSSLAPKNNTRNIYNNNDNQYSYQNNDSPKVIGADPQNGKESEDFHTDKINFESKSMFSNIISEFVNKDEMIINEDNNRLKQFERGSESFTGNITEILEKINEIFSRIATTQKDFSDLTIRHTNQSNNYFVFDLGIRANEKILEKYEGPIEEWKPVQLIAFNRFPSPYQYCKEEGKYKILPIKQKDPIYFASKLGRITSKKDKDKGLFANTKSVSTSPYPTLKELGVAHFFPTEAVNGEVALKKRDKGKKISGRSLSGDLHIIIASTWKEDSCERVLNQEIGKKNNGKDSSIELIVHHINGNQTDYRADNLEWVNTQDNTIFDSGKGIALFRLVPGKLEEIPLLAWPTMNDCTVIQNGSKTVGNYYDDKEYNQRIKIPLKASQDKILKIGEFAQGDIKVDNITYIMRSVVLLDRRIEDRTPEDRISDIIGYERILNGESVMVNNSSGKDIVIPSRFDQLSDEELVEKYLRGNLSYESFFKEYKIRMNETGNIEDILNYRLNFLKNLSILEKISMFNGAGFSIYKLNEEHQNFIWSDIHSEDIMTLLKSFLLGEINPITLSINLNQQIMELYNSGDYGDIKANTLEDFIKQGKNYYYRKTKLLNNTFVYSVANLSCSQVVDQYLQGKLSGDQLNRIMSFNPTSEKEIRWSIDNKVQNIGQIKDDRDRANIINNLNYKPNSLPENMQNTLWNAAEGNVDTNRLFNIMNLLMNLEINPNVITDSLLLQTCDFILNTKENIYKTKAFKMAKLKKSEGLKLNITNNIKTKDTDTLRKELLYLYNFNLNNKTSETKIESKLLQNYIELLIEEINRLL